jgi:hypothetical protein
MGIRRFTLWAILLLAVTVPTAHVSAGPLFGSKWSARPPSSYSPLHYWAPSLYYLKSQHRPVYYHQYAPGPSSTFSVDVPAQSPTQPKEVLPPPQPAGEGK